MIRSTLMADGPIPRGASIGRYVVQGWIAKGGMGEVYAAHDPTLDRRVAIKLVRFAHGMGSDADAKARLMREAQAIGRASCRERV